MILLEHYKKLREIIYFFKESNYNVTFNEFLILYAIYRNNNTLKEISLYLSKDKSLVSKGLKKIVLKKFLIKEKKIYQLTNTGFNLVKSILTDTSNRFL